MPESEDLKSRATQPGLREFIALMACAMSLVALSADSMLPGFPEIIRDLQVSEVNDIQLVVTLLFTGLAFGQLIYGPLSDSIGRKPAIFIGFGLFIAGCLLSMLATDFHYMLAGRLMQGVGAAGPRVVAVALVRDRYKGSEMARAMSFIMTAFILVPTFAPALGQFILFVANWRAIFGALIMLAVMTMLWIAFRQPETLPESKRAPFTFRKVRLSFGIVLSHRVTMMATLMTASVSGNLFAYLNTCQQIFQIQYDLGSRFALYFAILAIAVGLASTLNGTLVMRFGMHRIASLAMSTLMLLSWFFLLVVWHHGGQPPLWLFMCMCLALFFAMGVLFGNLNSIAMEPMGHVAGTAASVIGSISTLLAVVLGYFIGQAYDGTLMPMGVGFALLSTLSWLMLLAVKHRWKEQTGG